MKKYIFLFVISFCFAFVSITAYAVDEIEILDFKKVTADSEGTGDSLAVQGDDNIAEGYELGTIVGIYSGRVVLGDQSFKLSPDLTVKENDGKDSALYLLKKGMTVYYSLEDDKKTIISMIIK